MPSNPPVNTPRITPYLLYEDVAAALDWLTKAFGFSEKCGFRARAARWRMRKWSWRTAWS